MLENLGAIAPLRGDDAAAAAYLEESLALRRVLDDRSGIAASARFLGHLALKAQEYQTARVLHKECLAIEQALGNEVMMVADLASLAEIAAAEGKHAEARGLIARALEVAEVTKNHAFASPTNRRASVMRIGISGKGGTGKTTIAAVLARTLARRGWHAIAVDCDSDPDLAASIGVREQDRMRLRPLLDQSGTMRSTPTGLKPSTVLDGYGWPGPDGVTVLLGARVEKAGSG